MSFDYSRTFGAWDYSVPSRGEESLVDMIYDGAKSFKDLKPEEDLIKLLGDASVPLKVLDFGCGVGRNLRGMSEKWSVVGYDNPSMLKRVPEYFAATGGKLLQAELVSSWPEVAKRKFDAVLATYAFQHVPLPALQSYLQDLAVMTPLLVVKGRCWNDDNDKLPIWPKFEGYFKSRGEIKYKSLDETVVAVFDSLHYVAPANPEPKTTKAEKA